MPYIPHTEEDTKQMLKTIGVEKIEELFGAVPQEVLQKASFDLPPALSEQETRAEMERIASHNDNPEVSFVGGGLYHHYIPSHVAQLTGRSEFYTAYTPYQPEISQGILQAIFEYQTMITRLTGMDATNASMYDGSSASGEVCLMVASISRKKKILVSRAVHPQYREVMQTYCTAKDLELVEVPFDTATGRMDMEKLKEAMDDEVGGVFVQSPNFFGVIEDVKAISALAHESKKVCVQIITEAISLGVLQPPGELGVDIVVGEGQSFGLSVSGGGPSFGFLATTEKHIRKLPGRIVGETEDTEGNKAYVLTLQAREQHIRREKASSNICTNQALCALRGTIYLSSMGKKLQDLAKLNHTGALHFQKQLDGIGWKRTFSAPFFNEFVVDVGEVSSVLEGLHKHGIAGGLPLGKLYPELNGKMLVTVTEMNGQKEMDHYVRALQAA